MTKLFLTVALSVFISILILNDNLLRLFILCKKEILTAIDRPQNNFIVVFKHGQILKK